MSQHEKRHAFLRQGIENLKPIPWYFHRDPQCINLQFGENQEDPSEHVIKSIVSACYSLNQYPSLMSTLVDRISLYKRIPTNAITAVNGTDEAFRLLAEAFLMPGDEVMIFPPTYPSIKPSVALMNGSVIRMALDDHFMLPSFRRISEQVTNKTKMIYVANPNVPTGNVVATHSQIKDLLSLPVIVVVDECYYELSRLSVEDLLSQYNNLIILRSFSKTYALAGIRIGYIISEETTAAYLRNIALSLEPFSPTLSMVAAIAALEDEGHLQMSLANLRESRLRLETGLKAMGLICSPSETTSLLVDTINVGLRGSEFVDSLAACGVRTKTCEIYEHQREGWVFFGTPRLDQVDLVLDKTRHSLQLGSDFHNK